MGSVIVLCGRLVGVEGYELDRPEHSDAGMSPFGVVPALMVSVGTPVPADGLEPGDRDGCPRCRFVVGLSACLRVGGGLGGEDVPVHDRRGVSRRYRETSSLFRAVALPITGLDG